MTTLAERFGNRLHELRINAGYTSQKALAAAIGMSQSTINFYENGERQPNIENLKIIADFFGVSYDYLLGETDAANRENIDISAATGLNDAAIKTLSDLHDLAKDSAIAKIKLSFLNELLIDDMTDSILSDIISQVAIKKYYQDYMSDKGDVYLTDSNIESDLFFAVHQLFLDDKSAASIADKIKILAQSERYSMLLEGKNLNDILAPLVAIKQTDLEGMANRYKLLSEKLLSEDK